MKMKFIPVNEPLLDGNEKKYLVQCIDTGWISSEGPFVRQFETQFAERVGRRYGIALANGSVALDCALAALQIGTGDEVILPTFTIISCAAAIIRSGALPVLVDCDPLTWNMEVRQIEKKITARTKAIMAVHIYGLPVDMDPLLDLAAKHNLYLIEDAAEAHGLTYKDRACGSFGDLSSFSFYANKLVTTGEGGMLVTDDERLAQSCRSLRNLCFQDGNRFVHEQLGWNLRMSNLQAAMGVAQLERFEEFLSKKRRIGARYRELLADIDGIQLPLTDMDYARNVYWVFGIVLKDEIPFTAAEAIERLHREGIGCRAFFWPMHQQPVFTRMGLFKGEKHPNAERIARRGFYVPSGLAITDEQIQRVAEAIHRVIQ
jgi:perosamine synthetase